MIFNSILSICDFTAILISKCDVKYNYLTYQILRINVTAFYSVKYIVYDLFLCQINTVLSGKTLN